MRRTPPIRSEAQNLQRDMDDMLQFISDDIGMDHVRFTPKTIENMVDKVVRKNDQGKEYGLMDIKDHARYSLFFNGFRLASVTGAPERLSNLIGSLKCRKHR